jgi:integrase
LLGGAYSLDSKTVDIVRTHRARQIQERIAAGPAWQGDTDVFVDEIGRPIHPDAFSKSFNKLALAAGLPRIGPHGLRHTYAKQEIATQIASNIDSYG